MIMYERIADTLKDFPGVSEAETDTELASSIVTFKCINNASLNAIALSLDPDDVEYDPWRLEVHIDGDYDHNNPLSLWYWIIPADDFEPTNLDIDKLVGELEKSLIKEGNKIHI